MTGGRFCDIRRSTIAARLEVHHAADEWGARRKLDEAAVAQVTSANRNAEVLAAGHNSLPWSSGTNTSHAQSVLSQARLTPIERNRIVHDALLFMTLVQIQTQEMRFPLCYDTPATTTSMQQQFDFLSECLGRQPPSIDCSLQHDRIIAVLQPNATVHHALLSSLALLGLNLRVAHRSRYRVSERSKLLKNILVVFDHLVC